jgi:hypothetical protein
VLHLRLIILLVESDAPVNSETLLITDFMNLKIKPAQSFRYAHRCRMCIRIFIGVSVHTCIRICVCTLFLKKVARKEISHKKVDMEMKTHNNTRLVTLLGSIDFILL